MHKRKRSRMGFRPCVSQTFLEDRLVLNNDAVGVSPPIQAIATVSPSTASSAVSAAKQALVAASPSQSSLAISNSNQFTDSTRTGSISAGSAGTGSTGVESTDTGIATTIVGSTQALPTPFDNSLQNSTSNVENLYDIPATILPRQESFLAPRELVRDERQDAQDRRLISRAIPLRGSGSPCPSDKKARTMDPHRTGMEIHHACHRRPSDYHQPRPRPQGQSGLLAGSLSLGMSLPVPSQDEHLPDQIEAFVHQAGLQIQPGSSEPSSRRPTRSWSCRTAAAKPALVSSAGGRGRSPSRRPSARSPSSGRGSATSTTAPSRSPRPGPGRHPTNCTSPGTSGMRSVISSAIDPRARAVPRSAATPGMRTCWGSARSSTSCIRRASNWSARNVSEAARSWTERPRPSWPCSAPLLPTPTP